MCVCVCVYVCVCVCVCVSASTAVMTPLHDRVQLKVGALVYWYIHKCKRVVVGVCVGRCGCGYLRI